ncbi:MAG: hypothetical protein J1E64_06765 [Acetatifactor sp.]|nr:hypothetical protein [Acetatifactor sp.]
MEQEKKEERKIEGRQEEMRQGKHRKERGHGTLLDSTLAKIVAFILLAAGLIAGLVGGAGTVYLVAEDYYTEGFEHLVHDRMITYIWRDVSELKWIYRNLEPEEAESKAMEYLERKNLTVEAYVEDELLWGLAAEEDKDTPYAFVCYSTVTVEMPVEHEDVGLTPEEQQEDMNDAGAFDSVEGERMPTEAAVEVPLTWEAASTQIELTTVTQEMTFYMYVDPELPMMDEYREVWQESKQLTQFATVFPVAGVAGFLTVLFCFLFLLWSAGHHRGKEGISESVLSPFYFDILTALFVGVGIFGMIVTVNLLSYSADWIEYLIVALLLALEAVWGMIWLREFALRLKMHNLLKHTLIAALCRGLVFLIKGLPLVLNVAIAFLGIAILELIGIILFGSAEVFVLWLAEKVILFAVVIYFALTFKRLQQGSEALAEGNLNYHVDTSAMILSFKEHGENLNNIAQGMAAAVEQRMKSERLKTELITNVSHDLKTPLTSIINYADLIGNLVAGAASLDNRVKTEFLESGGVVSEVSEHAEGEEKKDNSITESEREQLSEYAEVLLRQSKRLKKLLDDLMEASKATTGNLEVNLQPCQVGVLLTQAVGEYEARFQEKELELITKQPEGEVSVMADGRHIWRVFDNLLNNICKYAQENTRVYLTVESRFGEVDIIFRNISKYPLDIMGEELKERFVRGDKSRHMEGNGLGLSIAGSLMELQGGQMDIVTDGDLFKVTVRIPTIRDDGPTAVIRKQQA